MSLMFIEARKLVVRALKDIVEGEDVTIDLANVMKPKESRQEELAEWRGIRCDCDRCREGDQENEITDLEANWKYRLFMSSERPFASPRRVFDGFMSVIEIVEKYQGRYHPEFVYSMYLAAIAAPALPSKTVRDKHVFRSADQEAEKSDPSLLWTGL